MRRELAQSRQADAEPYSAIRGRSRAFQDSV
jgi:hypothetical protein